MKVIVTGTRGIPDIQGGVETHCEELFPRLVGNGIDVTLVRRSCYVAPNNKIAEFKGVKLKDLYAPHHKSLEATIHTFLTIIWAKLNGADILHIHAIGPGILTPFARLLGLKVVFTHHGHDYDRKKWGKFAKAILRQGERLASLHANEVIVISDVIKKSLAEKYGRINTNLIFNGVPAPVISQRRDYIESLGLNPRNYVFTLGRFVGEKGFDLLINAFSRLDNRELKLVIAGESDHETNYSRSLKELAQKHNVILPGFVRGENLHQLFSHARLFVLPSFHEGLPISLLEAMSYSLPVVVSDIPANKQIDLPPEDFFLTGSEDSLITSLQGHLSMEYEPTTYNMKPYDWDRIALMTKSVYELVWV
ncbi:MAG: glycosyltransferase family 4 protein [Bacteroidales bacterium]|nr:glycosyltransferase family 4 protein [Bacteroidales bacterium]